MLLLFSVDFVHNCVLIVDVGESEGCYYDLMVTSGIHYDL